MNKSLLQINALLAFFTCFASFETFSMEQQSPTNTKHQNISFTIIKAAIEHDGDTMIKILDNTPVADRKFCLDFPEYNFGFDPGSLSSLWYKVNKNHFTLVSVGKKLGLVDEMLRIPTTTEKLYYALRFKDSKNKWHEYAIDNCVIKSKFNTGETTKSILTPLMVATYSSDTKKIEQALSKNIDHKELIHSFFIAIDQDCLDCMKLLLSKKDITKSDSESNCSLYRTLLQEAANRKNISIFEMLIKEDPLNCLNIPVRYPAKDLSDLMTVLDDCYFQAKPSYYSSASANEQNEFFKKCAEICKKYGAKTLKELVQEGYVVPEKPESPYAQYEKGWIIKDNNGFTACDKTYSKEEGEILKDRMSVKEKVIIPHIQQHIHKPGDGNLNITTALKNHEYGNSFTRRIAY